MAIENIDICIALDSEGNWTITSEPDHEQAVKDHRGSYDENLPIRVVRLSITMRRPDVVTVGVAVPDDAGQTVTAEVA